MTLNEKIKDSVQKTTGIRCYEGVPPEGVVGRFAYFFPLRSGAAQRYNEVAIFFMERPVFSPLNPEKATNDCRYLALNWLNGLYAYSGLKFQDILSQNNTRDNFGGFGVGIRLVLVDEARHSGGSGAVDNRNYFRITCGVKNGINVDWRGTYPEIEYRFEGDTEWYDFDGEIGLAQPGSAIEFRLKEGATWSATSNTKHFKITSMDQGGSGYAILSGNIMSLVDPTCKSTTIPIDGCFEALFTNCVVQEANELELPATTLTEGCYASMFLGCSKLMYAPVLPATTLANDCYYTMFMNTGIRTAPVLPATTLASRCYNGMFTGCTSLTEAPELPATTLASSCYASMFYGCSSLDTINVYFTSWGVNNETKDWVTNVADSGTFSCPDTLSIERGDSLVPIGWVVEKPTMYDVSVYSNDSTMGTVEGDGTYAVGETVTLTAEAVDGYEFVNWTVAGVEVSTSNPYTFTVSNDITVYGNFDEAQLNYLTFTALQDGSSVGWEGTYPNLDYSTDGSTWTAFTEPVSADTGDKIMFRNNGTAWVASGSGSHFTTTGKLNLSGNIMSLVDATMESVTIPIDYCFYYLFYGCGGIATSDKLELPATTLAGYCYQYMFGYCRTMTNTPTELPATTLTEGCYAYMFWRCDSIVNTLDVLPAATVSTSGYQSMFSDCSSLENTPYISATRVGILGCRSMFENCTSITSAEMEFNNGVGANRDQCRQLFYGCTSLNELKVKFTGWGSNSWNDKTFGDWVANVAATGDFYCPSALSDTYDGSHIPSGWTRHNID